MTTSPDQKTASQSGSSSAAIGTASTPGTIKASRLKNAPCHTCRRQRLRCDAAKPTCEKCSVRGVECLGYGPQPILWVLPTSLDRAGKTTGLTAGSTTTGQSRSELQPMSAAVKKRGRPKLVLMERSKTGADEASLVNPQSTTQLQRQTKWVVANRWFSKDGAKAMCDMQRVSAGPTPVDYYDHVLALSMLEYMNEQIAPDLVLINTGANPHKLPTQFWRWFPDVVMDLVISCSLTHQVIRCQATQDDFPLTTENAGTQSVSVVRHRMISFPNPAVSTIYRHQQQTLKVLSEELNDKDIRFSDTILSVVIGLTRVEIQQSAFGAWATHLHAARTIIDDRGGFKHLLLDPDSAMGHSLTTFMLMDIMSTVCMPTHKLNRRHTLGQLDYIPLLDVVYKNGKFIDFPCPNQLLESIIRINHVRLLSQGFMNDSPDLDSTCAQILYRIVSFNPAFWAQTQLREFSLSSTSSELSDASSLSTVSYENATQTVTSVVGSNSIGAMCEDIARAYQCAVLLYCIRTLYIDRGKSIADVFAYPLAARILAEEQPFVDAEQPHQSTLESLLSALHRLWAREKSSDLVWLGKFTFWTLWIAGMELDPGEGMAHEKAFICKYLHRLCWYLGTLTPLDAISALQVVWSKTATGDSSGQQAAWDERLQMPSFLGVFFF
ncbi:hypothetical protein QQS21_007818 [Conoideocrella luteorostrata]|uniref:Zn(2)-C6 fungal-type domain-containing protein n=1 Tax=Conoideocrella luteorostrata TaxID=1105319 RepID=A0AAJ0CPD5_9HYPO|nr:hypothetical protein QQS21_007818 [Conoideocrella luteorostrata]